MALRICRGCSTKFAVGQPWCPHCQSTDHEEDGQMPKITRHGGPSFVEDAPMADQEPREDDFAPEEPEQVESPQEPGWGTADGYEGMTLTALQDELVERGMPKSGNKADLVARLREHDASVED